ELARPAMVAPSENRDRASWLPVAYSWKKVLRKGWSSPSRALSRLGRPLSGSRALEGGGSSAGRPDTTRDPPLSAYTGTARRSHLSPLRASRVTVALLASRASTPATWTDCTCILPAPFQPNWGSAPS